MSFRSKVFVCFLFTVGLVGIMSWWEMPWCIRGDFNVIQYPCERSGDVQQSPAMLEFLEFIFDQGLMDIPRWREFHVVQ
jgi:hypothetical protein